MSKSEAGRRSPIPRIDPLGDFHVNCRAGEAGSLNVTVETVSFVLAQRIRLNGNQRLWESLQVSCHKEQDGSLVVQVLLWDPKSEDALQIALLRSWPDDAAGGRESLECDLSKTLPQ
jgi:hypothetical protein